MLCGQCRRGGWPKRQDLGFFIAAVRTFKRMNGRVAVGGVKIDYSASYRAAACWADVIHSEVQRHVSSLSLKANGGPSKGSLKIMMLRGRTDTLQWRLSGTQYCNFAVRICRDRGQVIHRYPQRYPQPPIRSSGSV
jgi:hypothetical protein